jgi:group II intron reverse transcriptase/maturase
MLTATVIRRLEALETISKQGKRINGLCRLLENPRLWHEAYANIYANAGAMTPGVNEVTLDGFSEERVASMIARLKSGTYHFHPVRRTYVPKKNGKKRPLGISSGDDKLVQEVVRIILERIYEPIFDDHSHGFRPGRSPHTALEQIARQWTAGKWCVDMDLRDYFNTIPHDLVMELLKKKIEDTRFLDLIQAMLDAGYLEDWQYHATYSGVPQGSIVSPILANVLLHELDAFMNTMKRRFDQGRKRKDNPRYRRYSVAIARLRRKGDSRKGKEEGKQARQNIQEEIRRGAQVRKKLPSGDPFDDEYRRLYFCRYADDFCMGIIGSRANAEQIRQEVRQFIEQDLKLTIAEEKSPIRHSKKGITFVGYELKTYSANRVIKVKRGTRHTTMKSLSEQIQLHIPQDKMLKFCAQKGYGTYITGKATHKPQWMNLTDAEIILAYNGEFRGLANDYALATGVKKTLHKLEWIWQTSLLKTLANKHKTGVNKVAKQLRTERGLRLTVKREQEMRSISVFRLKDLRKPAPQNPQLDVPPNGYIWTLSYSEVMKRLNRRQCEYCETTEGPFEVHHVRKLKDVAKGKALWQRMMAARHRKTLILCRTCHHQLHAGTLASQRVSQETRKGRAVCGDKPHARF